MATWQPQRHTGTATRTPTEMSTWPGSGGLVGLKGQLPKPPGHSLEATPARPEGTSFSQWVQSGNTFRSQVGHPWRQPHSTGKGHTCQCEQPTEILISNQIPPKRLGSAHNRPRYLKVAYKCLLSWLFFPRINSPEWKGRWAHILQILNFQNP